MTNIEKIRNVAIIGHAGEGKTTLAEAMLYNLKATDRLGKVDEGNTVCDYDSEEIARKTSISLALGYGEYKGVKFNLIDVPGFFDFEGEMKQALSVAGGAIIVTTASGNMTVGTEICLEYCMKHNIPTMIFVSGLDKDNIRFHDTVKAIMDKFPHKIAPMIVPKMENDRFRGWVDVSGGLFYDDKGVLQDSIPAEIDDEYKITLSELTEVAAGNDEELLDKYFAEGSLTTEEIERGVKIGVKTCSCVPVFGGTAFYNKGVLNLMDKIITLMPSPNEVKPVLMMRGEERVRIPVSEEGSTILRVFKTIVDPFVGKLTLFKVIRGKVTTGMTLKNVNKDSVEKISSLYFVCGKKQNATKEISAGDFGAIAKLVNTQTGETLAEEGGMIFPPVNIPKPVYSMAVFAAKKGEEEKVFSGLNKLRDEDTSFTLTKNVETNEMLINGLGDMQLAILCKKLKSKFGCEAILKEPKIAYRETIKKKAEAEGKHKKQSGGAGQFGVCNVRFEPGASDGVYEFVDAIVGGAVPNQFIPAVDKGLREAIKEGVLAGYPMVNLKCTLYDGKYHPVDSKEIAFVTAAKLAYQEGVAKASPCILEPIMKLQITIPDQYLGDVMGDMNKRRGRILGTDQDDGRAVVEAEAPQAELVKYAIDLRSMTQGRGKFTSTFVRYEEVPPMAQDKIILESKANKVE